MICEDKILLVIIKSFFLVFIRELKNDVLIFSKLFWGEK